MTLQTALIGFGKIAQGYTRDKRMAKHFKYASHAQVLRDHPEFFWRAVVDPSSDAQSIATQDWNILETTSDVSELDSLSEIEIAVIATPVEQRIEIVRKMPSLKAVLVEKPLGATLAQSREFLDECRKRNILVQVNLMRRADSVMRSLAAGELEKTIGEPQGAIVCYGNGLLNNGTHMIDLARMILGEVQEVTTPPNAVAWREGPIPNDNNFSVYLHMRGGFSCHMQPLRFSSFRENSIDIWGKRGRLAIMQEGLVMLQYEISGHRSLEDALELVSETPIVRPTAIDTSLYEMYTNLAEVVRGQGQLVSCGDSALHTAAVVEAAFLSFDRSGVRVAPADLLVEAAGARLK